MAGEITLCVKSERVDKSAGELFTMTPPVRMQSASLAGMLKVCPFNQTGGTLMGGLIYAAAPFGGACSY